MIILNELHLKISRLSYESQPTCRKLREGRVRYSDYFEIRVLILTNFDPKFSVVFEVIFVSYLFGDDD